jgi:ribosome maturation factor RimP
MIYQTQLEAKIYEIVEKPLEALGYEVVRIKLSHTSGGKTLQFMIERSDKTNLKLEDCETASRHISVILDVENPIDAEYNLEMSSAGLNRPLTREKDLVENIGNVVKIVTKIPLNGQKRFAGRILNFEDGMVTLALSDSNAENKPSEIRFDNIFEAYLDYFASNTKNGDNGL